MAFLVSMAFMAFFSVGPVSGESFDKLIPEDAIGFIHARWEFASPSSWLTDAFPDTWQTLQSINGEIERRYGFLPERDLCEVGLVLGSIEGIAKGSPDLLGVARWRRPVDHLLPLIPELAKVFSEKPISIDTGKILGKAVIVAENLIGWFYDSQTLYVGNPGLMQKLLADALPRRSLDSGLAERRLFVFRRSSRCRSLMIGRSGFHKKAGKGTERVQKGSHGCRSHHLRRCRSLDRVENHVLER